MPSNEGYLICVVASLKVLQYTIHLPLKINTHLFHIPAKNTLQIIIYVLSHVVGVAVLV